MRAFSAGEGAVGGAITGSSGVDLHFSESLFDVPIVLNSRADIVREMVGNLRDVSGGFLFRCVCRCSICRNGAAL